MKTSEVRPRPAPEAPAPQPEPGFIEVLAAIISGLFTLLIIKLKGLVRDAQTRPGAPRARRAR
jgi:hypothetical protein